MPVTPSSETPVVDTTSRDGVLAQIIARHGSRIGEPVIDEVASKTVDKYGTPLAPVNDPFYTYTWADGTSLTIDGAGQIYKFDEKTPIKQDGGWTAIRDVGNQVWGTDPADGKFKAIPGVPDLGRLKGFTQLVPIPQPDGTKLYYGIDPADGTFKQVPGLPVIPRDQTHPDVPDKAGNRYIWDTSLNGGAGGYRLAPGLPASTVPTEGATRPAVENGRNVTQTYTGGEWITTGIGSSAIPGTPQEGQTRPAVESGRNVTQTYSGGQWVTTGVGGTAIPGTPQEGQTRPAVENGRNVTQTYSGGQWITTGIGGTAVPGAAQEGQTRPAVENGRNVTQTFSGGQWITTGVGSSAIPGTPQEGQTRPAIQNGYHTTQTYTGGEWVTTDIGARAIPGTSTQVTAPSNQAFISTLQDGTVTSTANPSYIPQTQAEVAARVAQLQQTAQARSDELSQQVKAGTLSQADAASQFQQWWNQNIDSQKGALQAAQRTASQAEQRLQDEAQRANLTTAQTAGQNAVSNITATLPYRVGPGYGAAVNQIVQGYATGKMPNLDIGSAVMYRMPDLNQVAQQATAQALAHISPTAAQIATGQPTPTLAGMAPNIDVNQMLQQTNYAPGGIPSPTPQPPPVQPGLAAPPQVPPPPGSPGLPDWYTAWQQRQAADAAQQQAAAGIFGSNYVPGF